MGSQILSCAPHLSPASARKGCVQPRAVLPDKQHLVIFLESTSVPARLQVATGLDVFAVVLVSRPVLFLAHSVAIVGDVTPATPRQRFWHDIRSALYAQAPPMATKTVGAAVARLVVLVNVPSKSCAKDLIPSHRASWERKWGPFRKRKNVLQHCMMDKVRIMKLGCKKATGVIRRLRPSRHPVKLHREIDR